VTVGRGHAQPTPGEGAALDWIRPEEVPARADALLRRLKAARPDAATESSLEKIEKLLPPLSRDLDAGLARAAGAIEPLGERAFSPPVTKSSTARPPVPPSWSTSGSR
jgi:hypothetical protein